MGLIRWLKEKIVNWFVKDIWIRNAKFGTRTIGISDVLTFPVGHNHTPVSDGQVGFKADAVPGPGEDRIQYWDRGGGVVRNVANTDELGGGGAEAVFSFEVNMFSFFSDDPSATFSVTNTNTTQAQGGGDRSMYFLIPIPITKDALNFKITKIQINRSGTQNFFNKYIYEVTAAGALALRLLNVDPYSGDFTWNSINVVTVPERRYIMRVIVSVFNIFGGGGASNPFHSLTVYGVFE